MISRRNFAKGILAFPLIASTSGDLLAEMIGKPWDEQKGALIFDAMGELRDVYTDSLVREMLEAGMRAITVTVCDPKVQGQKAYNDTVDGILAYNKLISDNPQFYSRALSVADIDKARQEGKMAVFYLAQNSTHFMRDLDNVEVFHNLGLRSSQITYNQQNWAGSGCKETNGSGLTLFGHELVEKMNEIGMIIDLSHANEATIADSIEASKMPIHISHTCCKDLFFHERNVSDKNLKAMADKGGLVGITQMRNFMTKQVDNAVGVYFDHIMHAIDVCGIDHVCIGSDRDHRRLTMTPEYIAELKREEGSQFDASHWPLYFEELNGPRRMEVIWDNLKDRGLSEGQLEKVMGMNLYNYYKLIIG